MNFPRGGRPLRQPPRQRHRVLQAVQLAQATVDEEFEIVEVLPRPRLGERDVVELRDTAPRREGRGGCTFDEVPNRAEVLLTPFNIDKYRAISTSFFLTRFYPSVVDA